ncbi:hypothetical protein X975_04963, partial [Stegodyphus mimosarum]
MYALFNTSLPCNICSLHSDMTDSSGSNGKYRTCSWRCIWLQHCSSGSFGRNNPIHKVLQAFSVK